MPTAMHPIVPTVSSLPEKLSSFTSWPIFTHPPYLLAFLVCTLVPLVLIINEIGALPEPRRPSMAVKPPSKPDGITGDFKGDIKVNNNPPSKDTLKKVADLPVLDANQKSRPFKSLYADHENGQRRVLIIFIRHFFCGQCQEYIRSLSSTITPESLSSLPTPTQIVIIGCGQPDLIPMYAKETSTPYPIYADPTRKLYDLLGMTRTLSLGSKPVYAQKSLFSTSFSSFIQELRAGRRMLSGGDFWQVGGEFLFEEGRPTWCHRMKNTRDHAEIAAVEKQLGLHGSRAPVVGKR